MQEADQNVAGAAASEAGVTIETMLPGARKLVDMCANLQAGESVVVITDRETRDIPSIRSTITVVSY